MEQIKFLIAAAVEYISAGLASVFNIFVSPGSFLSLWPMLVAIVIGACVLKSRHRATSVVAKLFPKHIFLHRSAKHDYALVAINEGALFFVTTSGIFTSVLVATALLELTGRQFGQVATDVSWLELGAYTVFSMLVWDFAASWTHYLKHRIPLLWEIHKVHHSAQVMTPITAMRRHPVEKIISEIIISTVIGLSIFAWIVMFGSPGSIAVIFGVNAGVYAWRLIGYNLRHTHIWIDYGPLWSRIFISPAQHQIHHSNDPRHYDSNFGHIFSFWDMAFGTLYIPQGREDITFGIDAEDMVQHATLRGLYLAPLYGAFRRFVPARQSASKSVSDHAV